MSSEFSDPNVITAKGSNSKVALTLRVCNSVIPTQSTAIDGLTAITVDARADKSCSGC